MSSSLTRIWSISRRSSGGVDHASVALDSDQHIAVTVVKPTGIWMFHNNIMGGSPDGLIFTDRHAACAVGILEVKSPYSLREVEIDCDSEGHHQLHYLNCKNQLKKTRLLSPNPRGDGLSDCGLV